MFTPEAINEFLQSVPQNERAIVRDLLNNPERFSEFISKKNNEIPEEFAEHFDNLNTFVSHVAGGELSASELKEVIETASHLLTEYPDDVEIAVDADGNIWVEEENGEEIDSKNFEFIRSFEDDEFEGEEESEYIAEDTSKDDRAALLEKTLELVSQGFSRKTAEELALIYNPPQYAGIGSKAKIEAYNTEFAQRYSPLKSSNSDVVAVPETDNAKHPTSGSGAVKTMEKAELYKQAKANGDIKTMLALKEYKYGGEEWLERLIRLRINAGI
jgi:hypothetical protein